MPRYISPQAQYFDSLGVPLNGGKLFFYQPSTLILKNTYSDVALTTPNTNPIILATNGSPVVDIWLDGVYRVILKDSSDNVIWDKDPVGGDSGSLIAYSDWVNGIDYPIGEIVTGSNGRYYVSILAPNNGQNPISSSIYWTETRLLRVYNANETYQVGTVVQDSVGQLWRAKVLTAGDTPALGSLFWDPAVDGIDELNLLAVPSNLSGPANIPKSSLTRLTNAGPYTLPLVASVSVNQPIYLMKSATESPNVQAQVGEKIRIGSSPANTMLYDNFDYTINTTITLISNGTDWELS